MGSWQTCVRARTDVHALILTVKDLKELVTRKPAAEVELRAGIQSKCTHVKLHAPGVRMTSVLNRLQGTVSMSVCKCLNNFDCKYIPECCISMVSLAVLQQQAYSTIVAQPW